MNDGTMSNTMIP